MKKLITLCFIILCITTGCQSDKATDGKQPKPSEGTSKDTTKEDFEKCKKSLKEAGHTSTFEGEKSIYDPVYDYPEYEGTVFEQEGDVIFACLNFGRTCNEDGMNSGSIPCNSREGTEKIKIDNTTTFWKWTFNNSGEVSKIGKLSREEYDAIAVKGASISIYPKNDAGDIVASEIFVAEML